MSNTIYRYTPVITTGPYGYDLRPYTNDTNNGLTELCEVDNYRYVSVPEDVAVVVPEELTTWEPAVITNELEEKLKSNSPILQLIATRVIDKIREKYPLDDELYFARIATGHLQQSYTLQDGEAELLQQYQIDVETARDWGRQERTKLGL